MQICAPLLNMHLHNFNFQVKERQKDRYTERQKDRKTERQKDLNNFNFQPICQINISHLQILFAKYHEIIYFIDITRNNSSS